MPPGFEARSRFCRYKLFAGKTVVKSGIIKFVVVVPDQVERARLYNFIVFIGMIVRGCDRPRSVKTVHNTCQFRRDAKRAGVALLRDLIADAPNENAGVVAVT